MGRSKKSKNASEMNRMWDHVDSTLRHRAEMQKQLEDLVGAIIRQEHFVFPILKVLIDKGAITLAEIESAQRELGNAKTLGDLLGVTSPEDLSDEDCAGADDGGCERPGKVVSLAPAAVAAAD